MSIVINNPSYEAVHKIKPGRDNNLNLLLVEGEGYSLEPNALGTTVGVCKAPRFQLIDSEKINIPNEAAVTWVIRQPDGTEVSMDCRVINSNKGIIDCPISVSATAQCGKVTGEIRVITSNAVLKFYGINGTVVDGVSGNAAAESSRFSDLVAALNRVAAMEAKKELAGLDNGYYGLRAAQTAETYIKARQIDGVRFNYKVNGMFDYHTVSGQDEYDEEPESGGTNPDDEDTPSSAVPSEDTIPSNPQFDDYDPDTTEGYRLFTYAAQPSTKHKYDYKGTFVVESDLTGRSVGWYKRTSDNTYWYWDGTSLFNTDYLNVISPAVDCSTFVSLALRGIPYENSPWVVYGQGHNTWDPSNIISLYGNEGWEQTEIDHQPAGQYRDLGIEGYSSLRTAADFAEYYYTHGLVLYDRVIRTPAERNNPKTIPTVDSIIDIIQPGDIIFWSNVAKVISPTGNPHVQEYYEAVESSGITQYVLSEDTTVTSGKIYYTMKQPGRFRCVSHIAVVASDISRTVEVTSSSTMPSAVYYRLIKESRMAGISLIIRPDYRPLRLKCFQNNGGANELLANVNLCRYPWNYSQKKSYMVHNLERKTTGVNTIQLIRSTSDGSYILDSLRGSTKKKTNNGWEYCLTLSPGKYMLSGMSNTGITTTALTLRVQLWDENTGWQEYNSTIHYCATDSSDPSDWITKNNTSVRCYAGGHDYVEFYIMKTTHVRVMLYVGAGISGLNCTITPTLIKRSTIGGFTLPANNDTTKENVANKVTSLSVASTNSQYPSAQAVYDAIKIMQMEESYNSGTNTTTVYSNTVTYQQLYEYFLSHEVFYASNGAYRKAYYLYSCNIEGSGSSAVYTLYFYSLGNGVQTFFLGGGHADDLVSIEEYDQRSFN